jgi:transposase
VDEQAEREIRKRYRLLARALNERTRRLFAAAEAKTAGPGGIAAVVRATGVSRSTIGRGIAEVEAGADPGEGRIRRAGGGRKRATVLDPTLARHLEELVEPVTRGDPESPLRWTCKSTRRLAKELSRGGRRVSRRLVAEMLHDLGYSLQANRKTTEGRGHPDRNAQFEYIDRGVRERIALGEPVISVDTKKKELVGDFKNGGREWRPKGDPEHVRVHDFIDPRLGKAIPYGVYDVARNLGWVSVGVDHDTAQFAVATIRRWWKSLGRRMYPRARRLLIVADGGGSNGPRIRLWKLELQRLADETGLEIRASHLPPGTSKWNKIEHRLFSFISKNWRGRPLLSLATIVKLIAATRTETGLRVHCYLDRTRYPDAVQVSDEQMAAIRIVPAQFHGDWNYTIQPRRPRRVER